MLDTSSNHSFNWGKCLAKIKKLVDYSAFPIFKMANLLNKISRVV